MTTKYHQHTLTLLENPKNLDILTIVCKKVLKSFSHWTALILYFSTKQLCFTALVSSSLVSMISWISQLRDDIHKKKIILNGHCPLSPDPPPPRLNGQGGPFSGRQKRHFSAYYRIKLKSILIIKMIISVMKIVIFLMIMVMKMTKNRQIPCLLSQNIPLLGTIT